MSRNSLNSIDSIDQTQVLLGAISQKQQVLGANLANMNTPGYIRKDISFSQLLATSNSPLETKLSAKLGSASCMQETGGEVNPTQELVEMQKNALLYSIATRRVSSAITQLRTVSQVGK
ncbi:MAG: flagellar basal body protein [Candidatus Gastranaerophilaceae bacterium]|jgi:flagellar basal-body rod protein FlgB